MTLKQAPSKHVLLTASLKRNKKLFPVIYDNFSFEHALIAHISIVALSLVLFENKRSK